MFFRIIPKKAGRPYASDLLLDAAIAIGLSNVESKEAALLISFFHELHTGLESKDADLYAYELSHLMREDTGTSFDPSLTTSTEAIRQIAGWLQDHHENITRFTGKLPFDKEKAIRLLCKWHRLVLAEESQWHGRRLAA